MEEDSPSKPSVAELAGRLKGHILPMSTTNNGVPFPRKPMCSIKFQNQKEENEESDKTKPFKIKLKSSPIIEKLQANLALSPTTLLPPAKAPEVKLQPAPLSPSTSCRPTSPSLQPPPPPPPSTEEEQPVTFANPPEGTPLPSINKTRARLSFKRRPPTRRHRRSAGEEDRAFALALSPTPCDPRTPTTEDGEGERAPGGPAEEGGAPRARDDGERARPREEEDAKADPDDGRDSGGERAEEQTQNLKTIEEEQVSGPPPAEEERGGGEERQETVVEEGHQAENSQM